jgi:hypothetical protein
MALVTSAAASLKNTWAFSPQSIPGLQLWLDAADSSSMVLSGTTVTTWKDKSGLVNNALLSGGNGSPTLMALGTKQMIRYPNLNRMVLTTTLATLPTVFAVAKTDTTTNGSVIIGVPVNTAGMASYYFQIVTNGSPFDQKYVASPSTVFSESKSATGAFPGVNTLCIMTGLNDPTNAVSGLVFRTNGTSKTSGAGVTPITVAKTFIGNLDWFQNFGNPGGTIDICEIIVFNSVLNTIQTQQVEGYLAQKWGLKANLPVAHPYNSLPPFNRPFFPTDISGCTMWMDAADVTSMVLSGSNITRWNDKSGRGNDFTVTEGTPVLSTTTIGNPGVFFPTNSQMQSTSNAAENGAASRTSFFVADVSRLNEVHIGTGSIGTNNSAWGFDWTRRDFGGISNSMFTPYTWAVDIVFRTALDSLTTTTNIGFGSYDSITATMCGNLNFSNVDSNRPPFTLTTAAGSWWMGDRPAGGTTGFGGKSAGNGWICEFIQYSGVLTTQQRQQVESYLSWKWKTTSTIPFPTGHPGKLLPAFSTNFTPKAISGLQLWLDAADLDSITFSSGSNVSLWKDKSGLANNAIGSTTPRPSPVHNTRTLNRLPVMGLEGSTDHFLVANSFTGAQFPSLTYACVFCTVGTHTGLTGILSTNASGVFGRSLGLSNQLISIETFDAFTNTAITVTSGQFNIVILTFTGTTSTTLSFNGVQSSSTACTLLRNTTAGFLIGNYEVGNTSFNTNTGIAEILVLGISPTTVQRQQIEGYLAQKWGLQKSLPSTHPYAKSSP